MPVLSVGVTTVDDGEARLHERRNDVRLAVVETNMSNHLQDCVRERADTNRRLNRIEKGIIGVAVMIFTGGTATIAFLLRIVLHLG